jgi:hypothetical protein
MSVFTPVTSVQTLLDESGGAVFFTLQQIYDALNESMLMLSAMGKWAPVSVPLIFPTATDRFTLPVSTMMIPQYIIMANNKYFFTTHARLEQRDRLWQTTPPAAPIAFVLWDINTLRLFPNTDQGYLVVLWGIPYPSSEIISSGQTLDLPPLLQEVLIYWAVSELLEQTHPMLADVYAAKSDEYLQAFRVQFRRRQSHNISRLRPATRFNVAQSGEIKASVNLSVNPLYADDQLGAFGDVPLSTFTDIPLSSI